MSSAAKTNLPSVLSTATRSRREFVSDSIATGILFALLLTVGQRIIGFGRGILFCRFMTDQELGQWSMVWSYLMLLAPLAVLGLPGCFGKYSEYYRQRNQLGAFIGRIAITSVVMTTGLSIAIFCFPDTFCWILFRDTKHVGLVRLIAVGLLFVGASNFLSSLMESLRQVRTVTMMRFLTGVTFAIAGVTALVVFDSGASAATIGFTIACIVGSLPAIWLVWRCRASFSDEGDKLSHSSMWKRVVPFAAWLWASNLLYNMFEVSDRYMLIHWSNSTAEFAQSSVGQYHSGRVLPLLLVGVASMLGGLLLPYMSESWEAGKKDKAASQLNWAVKLVAVFFTTGSVALILLAPILFDGIWQGRYNDGLAILPLTLVYCIWFSLHTIGQNYLWVAEKGKWATLATGAGLAVNLGLNVSLIPVIGLQGAVLATAAGNLLIVLVLFSLNHRFGCTTDLGTWMGAIMPLILLLDKPSMIAAGVAIVAICMATNLIFDVTEKRDILEAVKSKLGRS